MAEREYWYGEFDQFSRITVAQVFPVKETAKLIHFRTGTSSTGYKRQIPKDSPNLFKSRHEAVEAVSRKAMEKMQWHSLAADRISEEIQKLCAK